MATFDFTSGTRALDRVLRWNTLDEAALLLSELTGEAWTPHRILSDVLDMYRIPQGKASPPTCLQCAPPHGTKFARYKWDAENGTPSNPFVHVCAAPYQTVALYPAQVDDLLKTGEAAITVAERPEDDYGRPGEYVFIEPPEQALTIALSSVGMSAAGLREFAARVVADRPEATSATPPPACSPANADDSPHGAQAPQPQAVNANGRIVHRTGRRTTALDAVIEMAKGRAVAPDDWQSVWAALVKLAQGNDRPAPLTGYAEGEGVLYQVDDDPCKAITKQALAARLRRAERR